MDGTCIPGNLLLELHGIVFSKLVTTSLSRRCLPGFINLAIKYAYPCTYPKKATHKGSLQVYSWSANLSLMNWNCTSVLDLAGPELQPTVCLLEFGRVSSQ